jgi:pimeloyl-ACP methyl ester carboxylesterase
VSAIWKSEDGRQAVERRYREILAHWPVPNDQLRVPTREGGTFVVACGPKDAPPLLLLHGSASNSFMWIGDIAEWSQHFRVYAVDVIGEPGLSAPSRPTLASGAYAEWLTDVANALSLPRFSLAGLSLGGWLALDYATKHPERIDKLVLLCPGGVGKNRNVLL